MYQAVINVKPLNEYKLVITFKNNEVRLLDMTPYLDKGIYSELKDLSMFNTVHVSFDSIEWANRADLDPEFIYEESVTYDIKNTI